MMSNFEALPNDTRYYKIDRKKDDDMIDISYVENSVLSRRSKTKITAFLITVVLAVDSSNISCDSSFFLLYSL